MGPNHDIYADSYSVEFSDDLEPVSLTAPGYRGDQGGWGFYYLNLTKALMHLYNQPQSGSLLAAAPPDPVALAEGRLYLRWKLVGLPVDHFNLLLDSQPLQEKLTGESADLPLPELSSGPHTLSLQAAGAQTYWLLSADRLDEPLAQPIPLQINIPFIIP